MKRSDAETRQAVLSELKWDTRVGDAPIDVKVTAGVVALTGVVNSWAARHAAQEAAYRVGGVQDVANDIEVKILKNDWRADSDIARAVRLALEWDVFVPDAQIKSVVSDGQVTLEGSVNYWSQRDAAEKAVRNLAGVRAVFNRLEIHPVAVKPSDVQRAIEEALERRAEREARHISVAMSDGKAILSGAVQSWAERQSVVGAARATPGVRGVDDRLRVEPYAA